MSGWYCIAWIISASAIVGVVVASYYEGRLARFSEAVTSLINTLDQDNVIIAPAKPGAVNEVIGAVDEVERFLQGVKR